jgi:hypothetical protein
MYSISKTTLKILQYNVRKSRDTVMATSLRDPRVMDYDVLAVQELWRNAFMSTTHHPAKAQFHLCYPAARSKQNWSLRVYELDTNPTVWAGRITVWVLNTPSAIIP